MPENILETARLLKDDESLDFSFLNAVTAVDYVEYFEMIYHLLSLRRNSSLVVKSRVPGRENPEVPSVTRCGRGRTFRKEKSGTSWAFVSTDIRI